MKLTEEQIKKIVSKVSPDWLDKCTAARFGQN